jgi:hypothetical protein
VSAIGRAAEQVCAPDRIVRADGEDLKRSNGDSNLAREVAGNRARFRGMHPGFNGCLRLPRRGRDRLTSGAASARLNAAANPGFVPRAWRAARFAPNEKDPPIGTRFRAIRIMSRLKPRPTNQEGAACCAPTKTGDGWEARRQGIVPGATDPPGSLDLPSASRRGLGSPIVPSTWGPRLVCPCEETAAAREEGEGRGETPTTNHESPITNHAVRYFFEMSVMLRAPARRMVISSSPSRCCSTACTPIHPPSARP